MKNLGYYNGKLGEIEDISVPMTDRVLYFGDGIYDATCSRNYKIFALDEHVDRFFNSARLLEINLPFNKAELKDLLNNLVSKMDTGENFVYFQASRSSDLIRSHVFDSQKKANILINIFHKDLIDVYKKVSLIIKEDTRFFHCNIKTLNLIPSVMYSKRAKEAGAFEAVLHRNGRVTECAHSNVSILKNGTFITAPTDNLILPGIARMHLISACKRLGIPVLEQAFDLDALFNADEIITSSASTFCISANMLDGKAVGGKAPELLKRLQDEIMREFLEETK